MWKRLILLLALSLGIHGCGTAQDPGGPSETEDYFDDIADARACDAIKAALVASKRFESRTIAGCDGVVNSENPSGFRIARVNGFCREEVCGSVLLGWYAVEERSGSVFEVADVGDWTLGPQVNPSP